MKRAALTVASLFVVAACQDLSTTPDVARDAGTPSVEFFVDNPPPPPIDSGAAASTADSQDSQYSFSFSLLTTYMFNKPENSGWLKFRKDMYDNTDVDNSAAIRYSGGVFTGRGTIRIISGDAMLIIDLAKVSFGAQSEFSDCGTETAPSVTTDGTSRLGCYYVQIDGAQVLRPDGKLYPASSFTLFAAPERTCNTRDEVCVITSDS